MGPGPEGNDLEKSGYVMLERPKPALAISGPVKAVSRFIAPLAIGLLLILLAGASAFYTHAGRADDSLEASRRQALRGGVEQLSSVGITSIDAVSLKHLEELSGIRHLRWEADPEQTGREFQSVQDANGRILGWLSWQSDRPFTASFKRFLPLGAAIGAGLVFLALLSMWYVRRLSRELDAASEEIYRSGNHDAVTGLPGPAIILEQLEQALARREADEFVTLCYFDLTTFREFSDAFGRNWHNELVRVVAAKLAEPDWPGTRLGRLGRHRFTMIVRSKDREAGVNFAQEAQQIVTSPLSVLGQIVQIRANAGLAQAPQDGVTSDDLLRYATLAMREARRTRSSKVVVFQATMESDLHERRFMERELKRAIDDDALELHYQPIVSAEGARIVGVEALLRWQHPTRGNIPPKVFVPVAEQMGIMNRLGEYVLYRAFNDAKRWPNLYIAVNLSPIQVKDRALFTLVSAMLEETGLDPTRLVLEITESVLIDDPEETRERLDEIRDLGVRIALDDFGAGYSSLSYLQHFPFDKLKIDSSFVRPLGKSENSGFIIQAIVALGRALNLSVLVEGVETEEQRILLRLAGCDEMQGFLFARPAPAQTIDALLIDEKLQAVRGKAAQAQVS